MITNNLIAAAVQADGSLELNSSDWPDQGWIMWYVGHPRIQLDGEYTSDELRALADHMDKNTLVLAIRELEAMEKSKPPHPFCRTPDKCAGRDYCPNDPACND